MKVKIKRLIAGIMSIMLVITVINFREIIKIGASEVSGYKIDVTYSEDNSIATLTGNTQEVKSDVQLKTLTDANGSEFVPQEFKQEISTNGEYKFILNYTQTIGETVEEKQQEITVKIDGIMSGIEYIPNPFSSTENPTEEQPAVETPAEEQPQTSAETPVEEQPETPAETPAEEQAQAENVNGEFPDKIPVDVLKENAKKMGIDLTGRSSVSTYASKNPTINYKAVTAENQIVLTEYGTNGVGAFAGGIFSDSNILSIPGRTFNRGIYVTNNTQHIITGLFPHYNGGQLKWYYTTNNSGETPNYGFMMPDNAEVWIEYKVTGTTDYNISSKFYPTTTTYNETYWNLTYKTTAKEKEKIVFEINLPAEYVGAKIDIKNGGQSVAKFKIGNPTNASDFKALDMINPDLKRYSGMFDMPNYSVEIQIWPEKYAGGITKYYGVGLNRADLDEDGSNDFVIADITIAGLSDKKPTVSDLYMEDGKITGTSNPYITYPSGGRKLTYSNGSGIPSQNYTTPFYEKDGTTTTQKVAWGMFTVGNPVEVKIQYMKYQRKYNGNVEWKMSPVYLRVDTYPSDISNSGSMVSDVIQLPRSASSGSNKTETVLASGAKVIVTCNAYNKQQYVTGTENAGTIIRQRANGENSYYEYNVRVENMPYAFKTYLVTDSTTQSPSQSLIWGDGIEEGSGNGNVTSNVNEDTVNLKGSIQGSFYIAGGSGVGGSQRKAYPLKNTTSLWGSYGRGPNTQGTAIQQSFGRFEFYIKVKEGYNEPKFTIGPSDKLEKQGVKNGYYHYVYNGGTANSFINWSVEPITFKMTYRDGKGKTYTDTDTKIYAPTTKKDYALYQPKDLKSPYNESAAQKEYFKGFKITYPKSDGSTQELLDGKIFEVGETVDLQAIYDDMRSKDLLSKSKTQYEFYIAAQWDTNAVEGALIPTKYRTAIQSTTDGVYIDASSGSKPATVDELQTRYPNNKFTRPYDKEKEVKAYVGSSGRLVGYEELYTDKDTGKKYLLSPESIKSGDVILDGYFAELVYMNTVNVKFEVNTENGDQYNNSFGNNNSFGTSQTALDEFNNNRSDIYYIPVKGYNSDGSQPEARGKQIYALELFDDNGSVSSAFNPGTINGKKFVGWKVKTKTDVNWIIDGGDVKWLNIYNIAKDAPDLWEEAVNNGTITLMPIWEAPYGPITTNNADSSISDENNFNDAGKAIETYTGKGYDVSATFKYTGDWNLQKDKLKVALFKTDKGYVNQENPNLGMDGLWVTESGVTSNGKLENGTNKVSFDKDTDVVDNKDGTFTVTFHVLEVREENPIIQEQWDNGAQWTIYAWNDKNGYNDGSDNVKNQWGKTGDAKKVPAVRNKSVVYPAPIEGTDNTPTLKFKEGDGGFTLTANFKVDKWYAFSAMWGTSGSTLGSGIAENNQIHLALYKQNPGSNQSFVIWDDENPVPPDKDEYPFLSAQNNKVESPKVTNNGDGNITVTWKIKDDGSGSLNYTWDHNAKYRIYAYNKQNAGFVADPGVRQSIPSGIDWPYVTTTTKMIYQEPEFYVSVPKYVSVTDEATGDKASGNGEVTYKTFNPAELVKKFPDIRVEMKSPITLGAYEYNGTEIPDEASKNVEIYRSGENSPAAEYTPTGQSSKYIVLGILSNINQPTIAFPETTPGYGAEVPKAKTLGYTLKTDKVLGKQILYRGIVEYKFTSMSTDPT